jgi:hypothetical protein
MSKRIASLVIATALTLGTAGLQAATPGFPSSSNEVPGSWWQHETSTRSGIESNVGGTGSVFPSGANETGSVESPAAAGPHAFRFVRGGTTGALPRAQYQHGIPQGQ